jgi:hypothetical protein
MGLYVAEIDHLVAIKFSMMIVLGFQSKYRPPTVPVAVVDTALPCF